MVISFKLTTKFEISLTIILIFQMKKLKLKEIVCFLESQDWDMRLFKPHDLIELLLLTIVWLVGLF